MRVSAARLVPIAVAIALNCSIAGAVARHAPQYLADWRQAHKPDAAHYVLLGKNFWQNGNFSRQAGPPFVPDILRTPVYPLLAGGIEVLTGTVLPLFVVQTALFVLCVDLTYRLGARVAGPRVGVVAALLLSADLMLAVSNWEAMSEPLYMALQTVAVVVLFRMLRHPSPSPWTAVVLGFLLGLATLTRPAGIYLPFVYAGLMCAGMQVRWPVRLGVAGLLLASS